MQAVQVMHLLSIGGLLPFRKDRPHLQLIRGTEQVAAVVTVDVVVCATQGSRQRRQAAAQYGLAGPTARPIASSELF
jgi:hypothetical protein